MGDMLMNSSPIVEALLNEHLVVACMCPSLEHYHVVSDGSEQVRPDRPPMLHLSVPLRRCNSGVFVKANWTNWHAVQDKTARSVRRRAQYCSRCWRSWGLLRCSAS